jgi:hypothetical protein
MNRFRQVFTFLALGLAITVSMRAQSLTAVRDTIRNADGSPFNGQVVVSWQGFTAAGGATITPHSTAVIVVNGYFSLDLVPTSNASPGAVYTVRYESNDGTRLWTEYWQVTPSGTPLIISQVRVTLPPGQGGGTGSGGPISLPIQESNVANLLPDLAARPTKAANYTSSRTAAIDSSGNISSVAGNSADCVHVDGSSGSCGASGPVLTVAFVDGETPSGIVDGTNLMFTLSQAPLPPASLSLYRNGIMLRQGLDFNLSGNSLEFVPQSGPQTTDLLTAFYRVAGTTTASVNFADGEVPAGSIDGVNSVFTVAAAPNPAASLQLFKNGALLRPGADYTLTGRMITFVPATLPKAGDVLQAFYRY